MHIQTHHFPQVLHQIRVSTAPCNRHSLTRQLMWAGLWQHLNLASQIFLFAGSVCVCVCVCVYVCVLLCHMQCAGEGSLEHIGVRSWWLIIVANAYRDGSSDVHDSFKATHQDVFMHARAGASRHTHTRRPTADWDLLCHSAHHLCWVLNFITDPDRLKTTVSYTSPHLCLLMRSLHTACTHTNI